LFLSERTVESHLEHILTKLAFSSRTQVAGWIAEQMRGANGDA
jgi:DNA-binding NarL/FixJ family response regulator